ncbi:unnamed protein product [Owenia fusiformis]|uniref:Uncharacterized protein n=1 Tax=Owenia fusiformis TaxID=6347 RepID=A0A8J1TCL2_OWEFU|nr:unnamed protein product [Owenia fusiformis]
MKEPNQNIGSFSDWVTKLCKRHIQEEHGISYDEVERVNVTLKPSIVGSPRWRRLLTETRRSMGDKNNCAVGTWQRGDGSNHLEIRSNKMRIHTGGQKSIPLDSLTPRFKNVYLYDKQGTSAVGLPTGGNFKEGKIRRKNERDISKSLDAYSKHIVSAQPVTALHKKCVKDKPMLKYSEPIQLPVIDIEQAYDNDDIETDGSEATKGKTSKTKATGNESLRNINALDVIFITPRGSPEPKHVNEEDIVKHERYETDVLDSHNSSAFEIFPESETHDRNFLDVISYDCPDNTNNRPVSPMPSKKRTDTLKLSNITQVSSSTTCESIQSESMPDTMEHPNNYDVTRNLSKKARCLTKDNEYKAVKAEYKRRYTDPIGHQQLILEAKSISPHRQKEDSTKSNAETKFTKTMLTPKKANGKVHFKKISNRSYSYKTDTNSCGRTSSKLKLPPIDRPSTISPRPFDEESEKQYKRQVKKKDSRPYKIRTRATVTTADPLYKETITDIAQNDTLLDYFSHSDDVFIVRKHSGKPKRKGFKEGKQNGGKKSRKMRSSTNYKRTSPAQPPTPPGTPMHRCNEMPIYIPYGKVTPTGSQAS